MKKISRHSTVSSTVCTSVACVCHSQGTALGRREFLKLSGLATTGLALTGLPVMAGPFTRADFSKFVPEDKKLDPAWVQSLFDRGEPETLREGNLKYVGMPVGGLCSGQLYLGGDGWLWRWDIFNQYHAAKRNPWNEVECGDHYARSMASYGVYLAACGFEYDGPRGHIGFAPRLTPEDFRCAFTSAKGWGTFSQKSEEEGQRVEVKLKWGRLRLKTLALQLPAGKIQALPQVSLDGKALPAKLVMAGSRAEIQLEGEAVLNADQSLNVVIT